MKPAYLICEIGLNHEGSMARARQMINEIAAAGGNAAKFQAVIPRTLVSKSAPTYFQQFGEHAQTQREFFERVKPFTPEQYAELAEHCATVGIDFLCTPFDVESVEWLNPLVPAFKIASADITNYPLLEAVARTSKPVYLSTGAAMWDEIDVAERLLSMAGCHVTLLHCVLSYPTPPNEASLGFIRQIAPPGLPGWHQWGVGYSDHTLFNLDVLTTAWLLGATVIEKHFTLDKTLPGNDHYHSMDPNDLRALVAKLKALQVVIGTGEKRVLPIEEPARLHARRSLHAARDLPSGHVLTPGDVALKRPGHGPPPSELPQFIGQILLRPVREDDLLHWEHIRALP